MPTDSDPQDSTSLTEAAEDRDLDASSGLREKVASMTGEVG